MLHGTKSYVLQTADGQIAETHSISAGLDYPSVGPEHAWLRDQERAGYTYATDDEALEGVKVLSEMEGIKSVEGSPEAKTVDVEWDDPASLDKIKETLKEINYPAT